MGSQEPRKVNRVLDDGLNALWIKLFLFSKK